MTRDDPRTNAMLDEISRLRAALLICVANMEAMAAFVPRDLNVHEVHHAQIRAARRALGHGVPDIRHLRPPT